jgi:hypothetical protein
MGFLGLWRWRVMLLVGLVLAGSTVAGVAAGGQVGTHRLMRNPHGPSGMFAPTHPGLVVRGAGVRASSLRTPHAVRSEAPAKAGAEVPWLRRANADTFVAGSGRLMTRIYPFAVNYRTSAGSFAPINTALKPAGAGFVQRANDLGVSLPKSASAPARVSDRAGSLSFGLVGASGTRRVTGQVETFSAAGGGTGLAFDSMSSGVGWKASAAGDHGVSWLVSASSGLAAKLVSGGVAFRNARGKTAWVFTAPVAHLPGASRPLPTRLTVRHTARGTMITVTAPARSALGRADGRSSGFAVFHPSAGAMIVPTAVPTDLPVVFTGTVVPGNENTLVGSGVQTGDCYVDSISPNTSFCSGDSNFVGPHDNALINFDVADNIPMGVQVLQAYAVMTLTSESTTTDEDEQPRDLELL